jgi:hypothetical protein
VKSYLRWSIFCAATKRKMRRTLDWEPFYAIAATPGHPYEEKLDGYAKIADERFETARFEEFCDKHLKHLDEVAWEFFGTAEAKEAVRQKVSGALPRPRGRAFHRALLQPHPSLAQRLIDLSGFLCALGEAVNGPGGYFGLSLHALEDCLVGGFGMTPPWVLELSDESHLAAVLDAAALAAWAEDALARGTYLDDQGRDWLIATAHEAKEGQRTLWHEAKKLLLGLGVSVIDLRARTGG